jgi:hypothetical protein
MRAHPIPRSLPDSSETFRHGNITVKSGQLRLSALALLFTGQHQVRGALNSFRLCCVAQTRPINRFAARQYWALACDRAAEDNYYKVKFDWQKLAEEATDFAATGLQEINDFQHPPDYCR